MLRKLRRFLALSQFGDNRIQVLRSELNGRWITHDEYIREIIELQKMRGL